MMPIFLTTIATTTFLLAASAAPESSDGEAVLWAGHQISFGSRDVPFRGEVATRMDTLVLAKVEFDGSRLVIDQVACAVRFDEVGGVRVTMDAAGLPRTRMMFALQDGGEMFLAKSTVAWDDEDVDGDGHPGITIEVDAPVCSGDLYVSNRSRTRAEGHFEGELFRGRAKVKVEQEVLGTRGRCLGVVARDITETVSGPFAYARAPKGSTCASLISSGWPIDAES